MPINPKWTRWAWASVLEHFIVALANNPNPDTDPLPVFAEGQKRDTNDLKTFCEIRMDGPWFTEVSKDCWRIYGEVNALVSAHMDEKDMHILHRSVGEVTAAFTDISVYRFGDEATDDDSFVWCWKLIQDMRARERVQVANFGVIEPNTKLSQAIVEGHYDVLYNP